MHGLEAEYWGRVDFVYLDRDAPANQDLLDRYAFRYQPLWVFVAPDGTEIQRWAQINPDEFRQVLDEYLASVE